MTDFNGMLPPLNGADAENLFPEYVGSLMVRPSLLVPLCLGSPQEGEDTAAPELAQNKGVGFVKVG